MLDLNLLVASLNARISSVRGDQRFTDIFLTPPTRRSLHKIPRKELGKAVEHGLNNKVPIPYSNGSHRFRNRMVKTLKEQLLTE